MVDFTDLEDDRVQYTIKGTVVAKDGNGLGRVQFPNIKQNVSNNVLQMCHVR